MEIILLFHETIFKKLYLLKTGGKAVFSIYSKDRPDRSQRNFLRYIVL
jgi:hypothetical protein